MIENSNMLQALVDLVVLLLPAGIANTVPVLAAKYNWLPSLAGPLDGGSGVLGENKTIRGLLLGILFGSITGYILYLLGIYRELPFAIMFGGLLGFGALVGDAIKSFFKRKLHIPSGQPWRPWDQIDSVIGALLVAIVFVSLTWQQIVFAIIFFGALSFATSYIGHALKIKKSI